MLKSVHTDKETRAARLQALQKRHDDLDHKIESVRTHDRSISDFYLNELKKQKLHLKDLIESVAKAARGNDRAARA